MQKCEELHLNQNRRLVVYQDDGNPSSAPTFCSYDMAAVFYRTNRSTSELPSSIEHLIHSATVF